jgi:hypothetical protein
MSEVEVPDRMMEDIPIPEVDIMSDLEALQREESMVNEFLSEANDPFGQEDAEQPDIDLNYANWILKRKKILRRRKDYISEKIKDSVAQSREYRKRTEEQIENEESFRDHQLEQFLYAHEDLIAWRSDGTGSFSLPDGYVRIVREAGKLAVTDENLMIRHVEENLDLESILLETKVELDLNGVREFLDDNPQFPIKGVAVTDGEVIVTDSEEAINSIRRLNPAKRLIKTKKSIDSGSMKEYMESTGITSMPGGGLKEDKTKFEVGLKK